MDAGAIEGLSDAELRALLGRAVVEYSRRVQAAVEDGRAPMDALDRDALTATDVLIAARHMLDAFDIAAFELAALRY